MINYYMKSFISFCQKVVFFFFVPQETHPVNIIKLLFSPRYLTLENSRACVLSFTARNADCGFSSRIAIARIGRRSIEPGVPTVVTSSDDWNTTIPKSSGTEEWNADSFPATRLTFFILRLTRILRCLPHDVDACIKTA